MLRLTEYIEIVNYTPLILVQNSFLCYYDNVDLYVGISLIIQPSLF